MMQTARPSLSAVIVNYRASAVIKAHLHKLITELEPYPNGRIYIVDNASPGDEYAELQSFVEENQLQERVVVIDAGANLGFAGGNNLGFEKARGHHSDYMLFINPDAYPREGAIEHLLSTLTDNTDTAIAGAKLVNEDGSSRHCYFDFPSWSDEFIHESGLRALFQTSKPQTRTDDAKEPFIVDWVSGAAFLLRTDAIGDGPVMDDQYFLYFEETDMMLNLTRQGWKIRHVPQARVVHIGGLSTGVEHSAAQPKRLPAYWFQSWRRYFRKNYGLFYAVVAAAAKTIGVFAYRAKQAIRGKTNAKPRRYIQDVMAKCLAATITGK